MTEILYVQPIIYRLKDVARALFVTERTARRWVADGLLQPRGYRKGGGTRLELIFTHKEINEFLDQWLITPADLSNPPRGKEARVREIREIIGNLRIFAGKATAAKFSKQLLR